MRKGLLALFASLLIFGLLTQTHFGTLLRTGNLEEIAAYIRTFGWLAVFVSGLTVMLQTFFPFVPFFLLAGVNVLVFGSVGGFLVTWLAAVAGAQVSFLLARYVAYEWAQRKVLQQPFFQKLNAHATQSGFRIILMARLIPVIPSGVINAAAGISTIRFSQFFTATLLGKLPITLLESVLGHDLFNFHQHKGRFFAVLAILAALMWGGSKLGQAQEKAAASRSVKQPEEGNADGRE